MIPPIEETGFQPIFDGKSLAGWDGDPKFWRVENGAIVGQTTTDKQPEQNTFLIWRGGSPADFELKLQFKLTGFNSGIQFRSIELPDIKYAMKGYQADMDGEQQYTGQIYEERGRGFLAMRGQFSYIGEGKKPALVGSVGDSEELKKLIKGEDWNDLHLIARGNTIIQLLNGRITSMLIDDDTAGPQARRPDRHTVPQGTADEDRSAQYPPEEDTVIARRRSCPASRRWPKSPAFPWARFPT